MTSDEFTTGVWSLGCQSGDAVMKLYNPGKPSNDITLNTLNGTIVGGGRVALFNIRMVTQSGAFAALPASPAIGERFLITDARACTFNTAVTVGGGATKCPVVYTGAAWVGG